MSGLLAVVPARGGSKGVPGKALRNVGGVPLLLRTLRTVQDANVAERVVVSTDCPQIKSYASVRGFEVLDRPAELATDEVPLAAVARHTIESQEWDGPLGLFQPTCPLLTSATVKDAYRTFTDSDTDWLITTTEDPHIHWHAGQPVGSNGRMNRQDVRVPLHRETGAVQLMTAEYARTGEGSRDTFAIPDVEGLDIDTPTDLVIAERLLAAGKRVHFVVAMGHQIGTGHFWRSLAIARSLGHHHVSWEWRGQPYGWAQDLLDSQVRPVRAHGKPDLIVYDALTVDERELLTARLHETRIVMLEAHSAHADLQVNALLDREDLGLLVVRDEFCQLPARQHRNPGRRVLVTFGGTDPAKLTGRVIRALADHAIDLRTIRPGRPVSMCEQMLWADLVVTSQGRTVLEAALTQTPCISIAANEREARHVRLPGVTYLGLHSTVTDPQVQQAVKQTLASRELRVEKATTARAQLDDQGLRRLVARIDGLLAGL